MYSPQTGKGIRVARFSEHVRVTVSSPSDRLSLHLCATKTLYRSQLLLYPSGTAKMLSYNLTSCLTLQ